MALDRPTRRGFIREAAAGTLVTAVEGPSIIRTALIALATSAFSKRVLANSESGVPTYADIKRAVEKRGINKSVEVEGDKALAGNGAFKEFLLMRGSEIFGRLFTLEKNGRGAFDLMVVNGDKPESFEARQQKYERDHSSSEVIFQVAGAFSCDGRKCISPNPRNWEPDGLLLDKGKSVGWPKPNPKYGGVVIIKNGVPAIYNRSSAPTDVGNATLFQTYTLVENRVAQKSGDPNLFSRRVLAEREFVDASGKTQKNWMIIQIEQPMTMAQTGLFLRDFGVKNAVLLNTGMNAEGWVKGKNGSDEPLLTPHGDNPPFTNVLMGIAPRYR